MPHIDNPFSEAYLDSAIEKMREAVREVQKIPGERQRIDRCKDLLTDASLIFRALQEGYDALLGETKWIREQLAGEEAMATLHRELVERIRDHERGILTLPELIESTELVYR